jgi:hypothetical protein
MKPFQGVTYGVQNEPALAAGAVMAVVNMLVVFQVWALSAEQLSAVNTAVAAVLAVLVRHAVRPTGRQADATQFSDDAKPARASR